MKTSIQLDHFCLRKYPGRRKSSVIPTSAPSKLKFNLDMSNEVFLAQNILRDQTKIVLLCLDEKKMIKGAVLLFVSEKKLKDINSNSL